jgi:predicted Rossmann fold flavoprotein
LKNSKNVDVAVIGGGAAGLMCAITAGKRGRKVVVLERSNKVGKKILMSGGGRCNFTNMYAESECYLSANPHFCKSALSRYTPWDFIGMVSDHGIPYHEKNNNGQSLGQLFCDNSSKDILEMLLKECSEAGVDVVTGCDITSVQVLQTGDYQLQTNLGIYESQSLVIASGALSIPSLGGSDFGYKVADQFGLSLLPRSAGLVPFTFTDEFKLLSCKLSGLSLPARVSTSRKSFFESILFTHRGLSGPAILQASSYWQPSEEITLDILPSENALELIKTAKQQQPKVKLRALLNNLLPKNLVQELEALWWPNITDRALAECSDSDLEKVANTLNAWVLKPAGTEGYRTAEVTLGGVNTDHVSSKTMAVNGQSGLYFIGEVLDVTGHLGGFNFQWAWASGFVAGEVV